MNKHPYNEQMKPTNTTGVYSQKNKLFTINPDTCKNQKVYNEHFIAYKGIQYRSWNPYRSKLAALLLKRHNIELQPTDHILYLGAATGTTISHLSDILTNGVIYAVESSPYAMDKLLTLAKKRHNIIPILEDANHPERYIDLTEKIDLIYQDISQRNQAQILCNNINTYLTAGQTAVLMVKARSIDVSLPPPKAYQLVTEYIQKEGHSVNTIIPLQPYEKDHAALIVTV